MIREIADDDFDGLMKLYTHLHNNLMPEKTMDILKLWNEILNDKIII